VLNPRTPLLAAATAIILLGLAGTGASAAAVPDRAGGAKPGVGRGGIRYADPNFPFRFAKPSGRLVRLSSLSKSKARASRLKSFSAKTKPAGPRVGELRPWAGLDFINEALYPKLFELRGVGKKIEVWVAVGPAEFAGVESDGTDFMPGDCRNGVRTTITDAQVGDLIREFDRNIYPRESDVFSVPEPHDGANALVGEPFSPQGAGDKTVVLVDNIRDEQFFDLNNSQDFGYVVGVFSSALDELFDRNMMTIDAFDWLHRSGKRPKNEPVENDGCRDAPGYPRLMEGVFAHEYQHLLEHFADSDEVDWVDEGLAEWARTLTGYVDPSLPATRFGFDKHIQCFLGNDVGDDAGPENSLTLFGDALNGNCDYGAVYTFMEYLQGRFGTRVMTALHRGQANGLAGVQEALGRRADVEDVVHDWAASMALDHALGHHGWDDRDLRELRAPTLDASVNWDSPSAYGFQGAAPNGSDYVRLRDRRGRYLDARDLRSLSFDGDRTLEPAPVEWAVDAEPPAGGGAALYSGNDNNLDRMLIRPLAVPAGGGTLGFQAQWNLEEDLFGGWDFTFVQVSTDGGASYSSIPCTSSRSDASPFSRPVMQENVPGYTAYSGGWRNESCSLNAYAGKSILVAFRTVTDGSVAGDPDDPAATIPSGFWLRQVTFAGKPVADGASLDGWLSPSEVRPVPVYGFTVQLVAYSSRGHGHVSRATLRLNSQFDASLNERQLDRLVDSKADVVAAIVTYDEPTEQVVQWARYRLTVNGALQPGG
jgi:hypothetical protein